MQRVEIPEGVQLEDSPCPNSCTSGDVLVLEGEDLLCGIPGRFRIVRCRHCGQERTNPRPTPETIGHYYPATYAPYNVSSQLTKAPPSSLKGRLMRAFGLFARELPPQAPGHMLELGCSTGAYLAYARSLGWMVEGIEYSSQAADVARASGFPVMNQPLEHIELPAATYDMVVAWMVLEHLHDPAQALCKLHRWVKPGGWFVGSVPDTGSLARWIFGEHSYDLQLPTHLFHFSPRTLRLLLSRNGWELERVVWQRNCQTLLKSAMYWADDRGFARLYRLAEWLSRSPRAGKLRAVLNIVLGLSRLSGRIEFWAKRKSEQ